MSIDLNIDICVTSGWLGADVVQAVLDRLVGPARTNGAGGFFFADRFTFGTPLYRSALDAAIQRVPGVAGVKAIKYLQRGAFANFKDLPAVVIPPTNKILRVDNDPNRPERGIIKVSPEGGR
jgi:hypothetical protein